MATKIIAGKYALSLVVHSFTTGSLLKTECYTRLLDRKNEINN
jgi:hypothetical protein